MTSKYKNAIIKSKEFLVKGFAERKPVVAYVGGWLGKNNLGDEALFLAIKKIFHKFNFVHYDDSKTLMLLTKIFPLVKAGILAGGTLINKEQYWYIADHFYKLCPNLYIFGTGVAHPSFWKSQASHVDSTDKWKNLLNKSNYIGVRGPLSADILIANGINNVEVIGDPVITFADKEINQSYNVNSIGLNIGQSNGKVWGDENIICREYAKLAILARDANWSVKWFVVWPDDLEITRKAANDSKTSSDIYEVYDDPHKYMDLVRPLSTFVGMKLHATILATCAYVPSIMLEYRPKCRDYMKSIGQNDVNFRTDEFKATQIWEILCSWNSQRTAKSKRLFDSIHPLLLNQNLRAKELMDKIVK